MGNARSSTIVENNDDIWWTNETQKYRTVSTSTSEATLELDTEREQRRKDLAEDFTNFKIELARKHERRRQILAEKRREMMDVRDELIMEKKKNEELRKLLKGNDKMDKSEDQQTIANLKDENEDLRNEIEKLRLELKENEIIADNNKELRISLTEMQKELQSVNTEVIGFQKERIDYQEHVAALKDVIKVLKEMLVLRGNQIDKLRKKITAIEELLASKEMNALSNERRNEYERQLRNMRNLRTLYEERQRAYEREKEDLQSKIEDLKKDTEIEQEKNRELEEKISELDADNSEKYDKIKSLESSLGLSKAECKELQAEVTIINQLFSQILLGFNNDQEVDLDKLIKILEENHDLLTNIVINDESNEVSALPKVLLDLINQVNREKTKSEDRNQLPNEPENATTKINDDPQISTLYQFNSPEEIVKNLPKVWRVLIELLSHQCPPNNVIAEIIPKNEDSEHPCYKSIETPNGTRKVLSVSKTFIRLKDLILEKKFVEKEMTRLKQLNTHLEGRLHDQERRLVLVSSELSKTWHVVGKMQKQHQQLHTQEKILRHELAQKRKLLTELKQELEYCREKWLQARKKNSCTEEQWKQLRTEFTSRKIHAGDEYNNSIESGFSDDKSSSEDEDAAFKKFQKAENFLTSVTHMTENVSDKENAVSKYANNSDASVKHNLENSESVSQIEQDTSSSTDKIISESTINPFSTTQIATTQIEDRLSETSTAISTKEIQHSLEIQKTDLVKNVDQERQVSSVLSTHNSEELQDSVINQGNFLQQTNTDSFTENILQTAEEYIEAHNVNVDDAENDLQSVEYIWNHSFVDENDLDNETRDNSDTTEFVQNLSCIETEPSTSAGISVLSTQGERLTPSQFAQEFVKRREARMKHLEEQCKQLYCKAANTAIRSLKISHKLDNLHETYGENSQEEAHEPNEKHEESNKTNELKE